MTIAQAEGAGPVVLPPKYGVRIERSVRVPMRDGASLSADLLLPDAEGRFPVVLEYIPYRKDDVSRGGLDALYYFAERGFVGVRLDVRGTGGSDGVNTDEYVAQDQTDGYDAVEWLAAQSWSNGNVGMFGTSYGGFTSIQVAMHRPPHLKAIVPLYATDDRYTDDCHYTPGGNMRMYYDVGTYGGTMVAMNALPPVPEFAGADWAQLWQQRLEQNEPYLLQWMRHQTDGPYWRGASLRPDYDRIACPVFLIAGWHDGYVGAMLRTYAHLQAPKKILIGPWVHTRPNSSVPGPRIDYLNEVARFFAHWLRGEDTGIMREPPMAVYMQRYAAPDRTRDSLPGDWRSDVDLSATDDFTLYLDDEGKLAEAPAGSGGEHDDEFEYLPTVGTSNRFWSAGGMSYYLADDQRDDEALSVTYTSGALEQELHLLGWPRVIVHVSSSAPVAAFVAKLADVAPDGHSALIADGSLNATRRESLTDPSPLEPGERYELEIPMPPTGWVVEPGHRLRLAISSSDFPNLWPTPYRATNRIYHGGGYASRLILPVVPPSPLEPPRFLPPPAMQAIVKGYSEPPLQQVIRDQISGVVTVVNRRSGKTDLGEGQGTLTSENHFRCSASSKDPAQASIVGTHRFVLEREDGRIEVSAESTIRATETTFHIVIDLNVTRNGRPFFQKTWTASEPRRLL